MGSYVASEPTKSGSLTTAYTITSRPSSVTPAASQPKIIGSRSAASPTPRSDQTSWAFRPAALTSTVTQPAGTSGGSMSATRNARNGYSRSALTAQAASTLVEYDPCQMPM